MAETCQPAEGCVPPQPRTGVEETLSKHLMVGGERTESILQRVRVETGLDMVRVRGLLNLGGTVLKQGQDPGPPLSAPAQVLNLNQCSRKHQRT